MSNNTLHKGRNLRKGWCPTLARPMETGDGWLVRLHIKHGILTAGNAHAIAAISVRYGNGHIDLTSRGNLQIRGVTPEKYDALVHELQKLGMADEPSINILISPLAGIDPSCDLQIYAIASELEKACSGHTIPAKFFCVIDGGGVLPLTSVSADMYFKSPFNSNIVEQTLAQAADGCRKAAADSHVPLPSPGFMAISGENGVIGVGVPFGRIERHALHVIADLAVQFGDGTLRLAPWRMLFLPGITASMAKTVLDQAETAGFIIHDNDARRIIQACPGAPACSSAEGATRSLALAIAASLPNLVSGRTVHVSGCAKGCACRGKSNIMITANAGGYDLAFDAAADAEPVYTSLSVDAVIETLRNTL